MDVEVLRKLLRTVVAGSLAVAVVTQPGVPSQLKSSPSQIVQAGCYPIGFRCGTIKDWQEQFVLGATQKPQGYAACVQMCAQEAALKYPATSADKNLAELGTSYIPNSVRHCEVTQNEKKQDVLLCEFAVNKYCPPAGRRPEGLQQHQHGDVGDVGQFFAEMAYLEEAAVTAFAYLARELRAYHAPEHFVAWAEGAVAEETEHAEMVKALARRFGAEPLVVEPTEFKLRPLLDIAIDNATEGCVREMFGALAGTWQMVHAEDDAVRAVTERIVFEESKHAALSLEIHQWMKTQLSQEEWELCCKAQKEAVDELEGMLQAEIPPMLVKIAGVPPKEKALEMFASLKQELWA